MGVDLRQRYATAKKKDKRSRNCRIIVRFTVPTYVQSVQKLCTAVCGNITFAFAEPVRRPTRMLQEYYSEQQLTAVDAFRDREFSISSTPWWKPLTPVAPFIIMV